jgi:hypothetical protein
VDHSFSYRAWKKCMEILRKKYSLEVFKLASLTLWQINYKRVHHFTVVVPYLSIRCKVVQIWPKQTVTCLHTNSPGHIWTTLYLPPNVAVRSVQFFTLFGSWFQVSVTEPVFITAVARGLTRSLLTNVMDGFTLNKIAQLFLPHSFEFMSYYSLSFRAI